MSEQSDKKKDKRLEEEESIKGFNAKSPEEKLICFNKVLEINPNNEKAWLNKGKALYDLGCFEKGIKCYDKAIELNPDSERAWEYKGMAFVNIGKFEDANKCYDKVIEINPHKEKIWESKGDVLVNLEIFEEAVKCYNKVLQLNPNDAKVRRKALEIDPKKEKLWENKGIALCKLEKYEEALKCYDNALEIEPKNEMLWMYKGIALCKLEEYQEALKCYEKALGINQKNEIAWNYRGNVFYILDWFDDARKSYDESLEINSKNERTWYRKGKALNRLGDNGNAIKCYDKALEINPKYEKVLVHKGIALYESEEYDEALICYNEALEINSKNEKTWYNKGFVLHKLDRNEDAIGCYDQVLNLNPGNEKVWEYKGIALCKLGKYEDAISYYDQVLLNLNPGNEKVWGYKGIALCNLGKYEEAIKCYDKLIELNPLNTNISKIREKAILNFEDQLHDTIVSKFRTCFRIEPPKMGECSIEDSISAQWSLRYFIQDLEDKSIIVSAKKVWEASGKSLKFYNHRFNNPKALLHYDLKKASDLYTPIKDSLQLPKPVEVNLTTKEAYLFLKQKALLLMESGFGVISPPWWEQKSEKTKLCKKLNFNPYNETNIVNNSFSFDKIIEYNWKLAIGDEQISDEEFEMIVRLKEPLMYFRGQWIELKEEEIQAALKFLESQTDNKMNLSRAIRLAISDSEFDSILPSNGYAAPRELIELLETFKSKSEISNIGDISELSQPCGFVGELRPYQIKGYSWLALLRNYRLGACLADDMGLGKTIQMLALLLDDKERGVDKPTLLICPTSVVGNWKREAKKFAPSLNIMDHDAMARNKEEFRSDVQNYDLVISTYALTQRNEDVLASVEWNGIVLDEAQNIKNSSTKQSQAVRRLKADYRVALTGTPVENRLSELWSIMEFLNPGHLGSAAGFRRTFSLPIERYNDKEAGLHLRSIVAPFVLRRMKTDSSIKEELPDKTEIKEHCNLTMEQATLYEAVVRDMLRKIEDSDGIKRKGAVLSAIMRLKQVCNHPAQFLGDGSSLPRRSGKLNRITDMLEEVLAEGDSVLIFTQFAEMGGMLKAYLQKVFSQEILFLYGGVSPKKRDQMIERFSEKNGPRIFVLSLKAGGVGLNLTRANHVFHFDRWWNPAVENQATDRAFRIGQTKNVLVHKFICDGTLEERIDEMIELKKELAENIIGKGERWLTEMTTAQLKELFTLRKETVSDEYD